jgi:hypothetical protein
MDFAAYKPVARSINAGRWWAATLYLSENPDIDSVEASPQRNEWTWRVLRTNIPHTYAQNTYRDGVLVESYPYVLMHNP